MIEINIRLDFSTDIVFPDGNNLGHVGEHNATTLTVTPPPEMAANENIAFYCLAFEVGNDFIKKVVRSALFPKADTFEVKLWQQVTISENFKIQLEAYDTENSLLIKTDYADAVLSPSVNGVQSGTDTSGQSLVGMVAANTAKLADFTTDENGNLLYKGKPVSSERPTAVFEFEGSTDSFAAADAISGNDLLIADIYMEANIPVGVEIKSIEFMYDEDIGWVDIREMQTVDGAAYTLSMHRTFLSDRIYDPGITCFAIVTFIESDNFIYEAAHAWQNGKFRITYYTENIGGENNA